MLPLSYPFPLHKLRPSISDDEPYVENRATYNPGFAVLLFALFVHQISALHHWHSSADLGANLSYSYKHMYEKFDALDSGNMTYSLRNKYIYTTIIYNAQFRRERKEPRDMLSIAYIPISLTHVGTQRSAIISCPPTSGQPS